MLCICGLGTLETGILINNVGPRILYTDVYMSKLFRRTL